jgi:hypothetical protein
MTWRDLSRRVDRLEPEHGDVSAWADRFVREQADGKWSDPDVGGVLVAFAENEHYWIGVTADPEDVPDWIDESEDLPVSLD